MLNAMRDGAQSRIIKYVLFSFLLLATVGLIFTDMGGFFRSGGVGTGSVAKAGDDRIGMVAFDNTVRRALAQQGMSPQEAYQFGMTDRILQSEISSSLLSQASYDMGYYVGDQEVMKQVSALIEPLAKQQPGISRRDLLRRVLQNQGMSEQQFINTIRRGMMMSIIQSSVQAAAAVPARAEALALYSYRNESRAAEGFILTDDSIKEVEAAPDEILRPLYEASKALKYSVPETRGFTIGILSQDSAKSSLVIGDDEIRKEYDQNIASYTTPERRVVQQAVVNDEESAQKLIAAVKGGKTLKDSTKTGYLGEQTFERNGLAQDIADATFSAEMDSVIGPFKTPLGWSVLVVKKSLPAEIKPFEKVKDEIRKQLTQAKSVDYLFNTANVIDDRLASGETLEDVARDMGLKLETIPPVHEDGATPDKRDALKAFEKDRDYILKSAFEMTEGESAPVMELSDGRYAAVRVDSIKEQTFTPFEEARDDLRKSWAGDQRASMNKTRAIQAQQEAASGEKSLKDLAGKFGVKVEKFGPLKRSAKPPKPLGPEAVAALFGTAAGDIVAAPVPGGYLIAKINAVDLPDVSKAPEKEIKDIEDARARSEREEMMQVYMQYLEDKMGVKINRPLLETMYGAESGNPG